MKNPIYILNFFLITISVLSCGQNSSEKKLNGKWYEVENGYATWEFYPDSLIVGTEDKERFEWKASDSKIKFDYITYIWDSLGKQINYEDKIVINYKINKKNDSLFGKLKNKYGNHNFSLIKAKNCIEYLNKKYGINFSLPQDKNAENIKIKANYGLNVFIGFLNNKVIGKTELSDNLNHLESDIITFKDSIKPNGRPEIDMYDKFYDHRFHLRVFADKKISDSIITQYLSATVRYQISKKNIYSRKPSNDTLPIRIYRIYLTQETDNLYDLKGKEIKTIANNIYDVIATR